MLFVVRSTYLQNLLIFVKVFVEKFIGILVSLANITAQGSDQE